MDSIPSATNFRNAKKRMCTNFKELLENIIKPCCRASVKLPRQTSQDMKLKDLKKQLEECNEKACAIMQILQRDKLKAVVFGSTSSGKSTLINALLGEDVLPASMGVCSSCLMQIEGCEGQPYLTLPDDSKGNVEDLEELGNELDAKHYKAGDTVIVHWPKSKCGLLNNEIQIIDRPGISSDQEIDKIVNTKCADADVHIFVVDSVSSITTESREYFLSVAKKISKPNIIFVYNKWDESAYTKKPERNQKIRQQHVNTAKDLLKEGLNVEVESKFDTKKIFFVSAREILWAKTDEIRLLPGHSDRKKEFQQFLKELQKIISAGAIKTRFGSHCIEGIALCSRLCGLVRDILDCLDPAMKELLEDKKTLKEELSGEEHQLMKMQTKFETDLDTMNKQAKTILESSIIRKKDESTQKLVEKLEETPFEEDGTDVFKKTILDILEANDDELQDALKKAVTQDLTDIKKDMEGLADTGDDEDGTGDDVDDTGDDVDDTQIPSELRLRLPKPRKLTDAALEDVHIDTPSYTDKLVWFRRRMSSLKAKMTTLVGYGMVAGAAGAGVSTGVGAGVFVIGSGVISTAKYLEYKRQNRRWQILETVKENSKMWLDQYGKDTQNTCLIEAAEIANNLKSTFDEKIQRKLNIKRKIISSVDNSIKQLKLASECLEMYTKSPLQTVKKHFQKFHDDYLQDNNKDDDDDIIIDDDIFEHLETLKENSETILDRCKANDDELHGTIEEAVTQDLTDIRRDMEDLADSGNDADDVDNKRTVGSTSEAKFKLQKPPTTLSDAAAKDLYINTPSDTDNMAWLIRGMSSVKAKIATVVGSGVVAGAAAVGLSTGVGAAVFIFGSGVVVVTTYLEHRRQLRRLQFLEAKLLDSLDQHGQEAKNTSH